MSKKNHVEELREKIFKVILGILFTVGLIIAGFIFTSSNQATYNQKTFSFSVSHEAEIEVEGTYRVTQHSNDEDYRIKAISKQTSQAKVFTKGSMNAFSNEVVLIDLSGNPHNHHTMVNDLTFERVSDEGKVVYKPTLSNMWSGKIFLAGISSGVLMLMAIPIYFILCTLLPSRTN